MPPAFLPHRADTRDYVIRMPADTGRVAACHEVACEQWQYGWDLLADERTDLGRRRAAYIRSGASGREYREMGPTEDGVAVFRFASHQRCFAEHRTRPASWLAGTGGQLRRHSGMAGWISDLDEHVGQLAEQLRKG